MEFHGIIDYRVEGRDGKPVFLHTHPHFAGT